MSITSCKDAILLPRPLRPGGPPILIGGNGYKYTLPLAAKYAREWNAVYLTAEEFASRNAKLDELLAANRRNPGSVKRSMMTGCEYRPRRQRSKQGWQQTAPAANVMPNALG